MSLERFREIQFSMVMRLAARKRIEEKQDPNKPPLLKEELERKVSEELIDFADWIFGKYDEGKSFSPSGWACQKCATLVSSVVECPHCSGKYCTKCQEEAPGGRCPLCNDGFM